MPSCYYICHYPVAPRAGAWIETCNRHRPRPTWRRSRPARARGLKHDPGQLIRHLHMVAPRAGAWIETYERSKRSGGIRGRAPRGRVD